jgi:hypothetical protein
MHFPTALTAIAAIAPFVSAHEGASLPKIAGLNIRDLKARNVFADLKARAADLQNVETHKKRAALEPRQNVDGPCGDGIGSCAAGVCCSQSGCRLHLWAILAMLWINTFRVWNRP